MAGNHPSELSPRQRMINMMYLVLTALLALNVSKEVLQSFFDVNQGITRTTKSFDAKNGDVYTAFDNAALQNPTKAGPFKKKAYLVKEEADELVAFIQEMKYNLVLKADKKVYLGPESGFRDEEGDFIEGSETIKEWKNLSTEQQSMDIGDLNAKDDRNSSGDLFWLSKRKKNKATDLKEKMLTYRDFLISLSEDNENIKASINKVFNLAGNLGKKKNQSWEEYNFHDMPAVGALTLLSKMQADVRNAEGDIINMLKENIEANSLKFTSAEGIAVQNSNFLLRGDEFRAEIFLAAKDTTQDPKIYIGKYKDLGNGQYEMIGSEGKDYKLVEVVNGKGIYKTKTSSIGEKKWGGLIILKVKDGEKMYPFENKYLVAGKGAVVSPTNMNVLYKGIANPVEVSVAGYPPSQVSASCSNGSISTVSKGKGQYSIKPSKMTKSIVTLYVTREGKRTNMGSIEFRVRPVPPPVVKIKGKRGGSITRDALKAGQGISAKMENFDFKGVKYVVTSYDVIADFKGNQTTFSVRGPGFTSKVNSAITTTASGKSITFANIKVKLKATGAKKEMGSLTFKIK